MSPAYSESCCTAKPVIEEGVYKERGSFTTIDGDRAYVSGGSSSTGGILFIYDVFGYTSQTLQGADILANSELESIVVVPDLFGGEYMKKEWYAEKTERNETQIKAFLSSKASIETAVQRLLGKDGADAQEGGLLASVKERYPSVTKWAVIGYCWGGKVAALVSGTGTPFKVAVSTSPALLDPADAAKVVIPMAVLASKDEPADAVRAYGDALKVEKHVETWPQSVHGWMSSRADLSDPQQKREYQRGYKVAIDFIKQHW
ncbi:hypothetical protein HRR81_009552 [Exophiala dermatitidis]|uniref:Carboxymethylenebutenolidase n=1 Tax=Exophiala dermatitidis (strain ATCC 34100 / CBS 525.76 / NIH/UT8656) TaxID=858893 RepID=H6CBU3_EXODN|nr:carboxymethylenebutenolidase [Exophiala dermatitidis NIH/UT8656]KAJ4501898.1 hypothetical protein HRR75_008831 [Exophiala dermatitidis]EHY61240.1 carboxymethylenebutenolidase [Exophiala dermatitidis NIH/UT8656]KAJ4528885.1 hypothetical protein HRR76_009502 [Exophiala dermatitidis]KAJ4530284.1 hypothetical protein HRR77_009567 [Exophiala dermatitidis]KAJ4538284.1 hypothetical protein HRR78_008345 [Exophiala dermatitidis]